MRLPAFLMRLWSRLTGMEPTLRNYPKITVSGKFDVNTADAIKRLFDGLRWND